VAGNQQPTKKGSRKVGRQYRWDYSTHSQTKYVLSGHRRKSPRGNLYHRPAPVCANCQSTVGPFVAGPLPGLRICALEEVLVDGAKVRTAHECIKRRAALDFVRYPMPVAIPTNA
jgi:hypothetical protein